MREGDEVAGSLDGLDGGDAGDGEDVAFFNGVVSDQAQGVVVGESDVADGDGEAVGGGFGARGYEVDFGRGC